MSSKLDQSLDEITGGRRNDARRSRRGGRAPAPVAGGVTKKTAAKPTKPAGRAPAAPALQTRGDSKIIVSNLPDDVSEQQIKEYFSSTVGAVKKVLLNYNKTGRSTGVATIIFSQPGSASKAATDFNGVKVDGRPMRIEVILSAQSVPAPPAQKTLGERIAKPKTATAAAKPKSAAAAPKNAAAAATGDATRGRGRGGRRGGRAGARPKKSAQELDAEMQDYFEPGTGGAAAAPTNGGDGAGAPAPAAAAPATNGGDAGMEDEIM